MISYICQHKDIVFENALRCNFALLNPAKFSQFEGENSPRPTLYLRIFSDRLKFREGASAPCHDATAVF